MKQKYSEELISVELKKKKNSSKLCNIGHGIVLEVKYSKNWKIIVNPVFKNQKRESAFNLPPKYHIYI